MNYLNKILLAVCALVTSATAVYAQPTGAFWTPCITDVVPTGSAFFAVYNYFTIFNKRGEGQFFAPDAAITAGVYSWKDLSVEAGIDYLGGTNDPVYFNAKVAYAENKLFCQSPSLAVGIFNAGTRTHGLARTNQNIIDVVAGKTLPEFIGGRFFVGAFSGGKAMGTDRNGWMVSYIRSFCHTKDCCGKEFDEWLFIADYASGKNTIGASSAAIVYFFTPDISLYTGPVFFNTDRYNGKWKWCFQLFYTFPVFKV